MEVSKEHSKNSKSKKHDHFNHASNASELSQIHKTLSQNVNTLHSRVTTQKGSFCAKQGCKLSILELKQVN